MAGAPCPIEIMKRVTSEMHMLEVTIAYGMTETSPVSFQTSVEDPLVRRVSTVGRVFPHTEVKIIEAQGRIVPPGTAGELLTRGLLRDAAAIGNDEEMTREAINPGAGCIRAIWRRSTTRATAISSGASRTW